MKGTTMTKYKEIRIYIPLTHNGGTLVASEDIRFIEQYATTLFGGSTIYPSLRGTWENGAGTRYADPMAIIAVVVPDVPNVEGSVRPLATSIRERFQQEEVFITIQDVDLLERDGGDDDTSV
jgi:hypothetical protein